LEQLDVKTTFLHGNLKEIVYIQQFEGLLKEKERCVSCVDHYMT